MWPRVQVKAQASMSMSLAQTRYCRQQGFDPQSPLCAHIILSGSVTEVRTRARARSGRRSRDPRLSHPAR